ncbi:MAG: AAA family ATPase [Intrasporangiaceae bacterium]|nr:AAA family ATPase [Intrasporangiaceae bacterium]
MWFQLTDPADPAHVEMVVDLARTAVPRCGQVTVIAIDGLSGSGKTTLAKGVSDALGAPVVHMDRLYPGWDGLADAVGLLVSQVLEPLARGERAAYRTWDWGTDEWNGVDEVPESAVLVIEGCGSSVGAARDYAAVSVFMEAPREERIRRGLERDGEAYRPHWERWAAQEAELFTRDGTREAADIVISTG